MRLDDRKSLLGAVFQIAARFFKRHHPENSPTGIPMPEEWFPILILKLAAILMDSNRPFDRFRHVLPPLRTIYHPVDLPDKNAAAFFFFWFYQNLRQFLFRIRIFKKMPVIGLLSILYRTGAVGRFY